MHSRVALIAMAGATLAILSGEAAAQPDPQCPAMRKISIGAPAAPSVVHTPPHVAKALGLFAKRCIEATIVASDGIPPAAGAAAQGLSISSIGPVPIAHGVRMQQIWGLAPRIPQSYVVPGEVKSAADLKGRKLSASGGVGGFNWRMGRAVLKSAHLDVGDAQFIPSPIAGRLPGLVAGQVDGVALHPEDVFLARKQNDSLRPLLQLADLLPLYMFNAYGASLDGIGKDRELIRDAIAALIEANRAIYRDKDKVVPVMVEATKKPKEAVEYAIDIETRNCVWSVNTGFDAKRTQWTIDNSVEYGDVDKDKKPTVEQVSNIKLAEEAVEAAGGRVTIGNCTE